MNSQSRKENRCEKIDIDKYFIHTKFFRNVFPGVNWITF